MTVEPKTKVIFRVFKDTPGIYLSEIDEVIAVFPEIPADYAGRYPSSYMHIGQHSSVDYLTLLSVTRPAKPEEYEELKQELEGEPYNYVLEVRQRCTYAMNVARRENAKRTAA